MKQPQLQTVAKTIQNLERDVRILALRKEGLSLSEIGQQVGLSKQRVSQVIIRELATMPLEQREGLRAQLHGLITDGIPGIYEDYLSGDHDAIRSMLAIVDRLARLHGLEQPAFMVIQDHRIVINPNADYREGLASVLVIDDAN